MPETCTLTLTHTHMCHACMAAWPQACGDGGELTSAAVELLAGAGYTSVAVLAGGYEAWSKVSDAQRRAAPCPGMSCSAWMVVGTPTWVEGGGGGMQAG